MIIINNLSKSYGSNEILSKINHEFHNNEIVILKGKNGIGKSTLINIISGVLKPTSGKVSFIPDDYKKKIGFILNRPLYMETLTLQDNLSFQGKLLNVEKSRIAKNSQYLSTLFSIPLNVSIKHFSDGMKAKVKIAMSLIHDPECIIWDEPFVNLDENSRNIIINIILTKIKCGIICTHMNILDDNYLFKQIEFKNIFK